MIMKGDKTYIILFSILMVVLSLSWVQNAFDVIEFRELWGGRSHAKKPDMTFNDLADGKYQANIENYLSETYGFREPTIRLYCQYLWSFYHKTFAEDVVEGKDGWFYFGKNINEYYGTYQHKIFKNNEDATAKYDKNIRILNKLRHVLKDYDVELLAYISPDKCFVFPEHVPDMERDTTTINTTKYFTDRFDKLGFPYIEMSQLFRNYADTLFYPPMSPQGAHWNFSCVYATDTVVRLIEKLGNIDLPDIKIGEYRKYDKKIEEERRDDYDIEGMFNLMFPMDHSKYPLYLADVTIECDSTHTKPSVLFVGNSFLWGIRKFINFYDVFEYPRLWYYNRTARDLTTFKKKKTSDMDYLFHILMSDYIVTFCGDTQLHEISFGFAGKALVTLCIPEKTLKKKQNYLCEKYNISKEQALKKIYENPEIFNSLKGDSIPTIRNEKALPLSKAIKEIRSDKDWLKILEWHGKQLKKTPLEMLELETKNIINGKPLYRDSDTLINNQKNTQNHDIQQ